MLVLVLYIIKHPVASSDALIIGSAIGNTLYRNTLYRLIFHIGNRISMCVKLLADLI